MKVIIALICAVLLPVCALADAARTEILMSTAVSITLREGGCEETLDGAFALCERYDALLSTTNPNSEIARLNDGQTSQVSPEVVALIGEGLMFGEVSNGLFDITIRPVSALWDFAGAVLPDPNDIRAALRYVDYAQVRIENERISLPINAQIDLGGIAKGYISEKLREYLLSSGVKSAIISLGGNVVTIGARADGAPFRIGLKNPFGEGILGVITSAEYYSVITSGSYERCFTTDGVLYHHILNPSTGYPIDNGLTSVTIISNAPTAGDALSTVCFALGLTDGLKLIEDMPDTEAIFVKNDGGIHFTSGFAAGSVDFHS